MRLAGQTREDRPERPRVRMALVSPTIDKRLLTEWRIAEKMSHLADRCEFHLCGSRVEDIDLREVAWHRIPRLPGSHLAGYLWWFFANQAARWWHAQRGGCRYDPVYSPGINCLMLMSLPPILELAKRHHLVVIEDAAQAHGAMYEE